MVVGIEIMFLQLFVMALNSIVAVIIAVAPHGINGMPEVVL